MKGYGSIKITIGVETPIFFAATHRASGAVTRKDLMVIDGGNGRHARRLIGTLEGLSGGPCASGTEAEGT